MYDYSRVVTVKIGPAWGIRSALTALIGFMPTPGDGAIGSLDYTEQERVIIAKKSRTWKCDICRSNNETSLLDESEIKEEEGGSSSKVTEEEMITFSSAPPANKSEDTGNDTEGKTKEETIPKPSTSRASSASGIRQRNTNLTPAPIIAAPSSNRQNRNSRQSDVLLVVVLLMLGFLVLKKLFYS